MLPGRPFHGQAFQTKYFQCHRGVKWLFGIPLDSGWQELEVHIPRRSVPQALASEDEELVRKLGDSFPPPVIQTR